MEHRCVQCGFPVKSLFVQYSPGNIRLMKCENCKEVADEYIECELMIILIDLILHKPKAYRHLLYNVLDKGSLNYQRLIWKLVVVYLLLDACIHAFEDRGLLLRRNKELGYKLFESLVSTCTKVLMDIVLRNLVFVSVLALAMRILLNASIEFSRLRDLFVAILISSYFKVFLLAMMVWEFPSSVIFIIDLVILTSNTVALKVMTDSAMNRCAAVCFFACAARFLVI